MKLIRWFLGRIILFLNAVFSPVPVERDVEEQRKIDAALRKLSLYQYEACPFCVKVRRFMKASSITVPIRNAQKDPFRSELLSKGGKLQVPCLKIEEDDGSVKWLYESRDIVSFLQNRINASIH
ncbi:MAG: glutathione S-transferase N-terminal domain-containing protein [Bdellovibrionota bacterium]